MKLSIIIPYFECYELTEKLVEVLEPQLNKETELIIIDDGCNELRLNKFKAKVIHFEENKGVAVARNTGIKQAKGDYIAFIDNDDMISNDYVAEILKFTENNPEIIIIDWQDMTSNVIHKRPENFAPWRAVYRKDIIPDFLEDKKYGMEDIWFTGEIQKRTINKAYIDKVLYYYNSNREGSLMWKKVRNL